MKIKVVTLKTLLFRMLFISMITAAVIIFIYAVIYVKNKENQSEIEFVASSDIICETDGNSSGLSF